MKVRYLEPETLGVVADSAFVLEIVAFETIHAMSRALEAAASMFVTVLAGREETPLFVAHVVWGNTFFFLFLFLFLFLYFDEEGAGSLCCVVLVLISVLFLVSSFGFGVGIALPGVVESRGISFASSASGWCLAYTVVGCYSACVVCVLEEGVRSFTSRTFTPRTFTLRTFTLRTFTPSRPVVPGISTAGVRLWMG